MSRPSPAAEARRLAKAGRIEEAAAAIAELVAGNFGLRVAGATLNYDWTSLNSLNGTVRTDQGEFFFKLHQEEGEEDTVAEYYRGELLKRSGYLVDVPVRVCRDPGRQILLYRLRRDTTLAAAVLAIERGDAGADPAMLAQAQRDLDADIGRIYLRTLHAAAAEDVAAEPIHRLFHDRLCEPGRPEALGGRVRRFYSGRGISVGGETLAWGEFAALRWTVNGIAYRETLAEVLERCLRQLEPRRLARFGAVVAHGDAHNANVWIEKAEDGIRLVMFDPAFAGEHVPAILAEVKATFHNIFAHPFWLYHPHDAAGRFSVGVRRRGGTIALEHDWRLAGLRASFLESKRDLVWRPLLASMKARGFLPDDWRETLRAALLACPTLVLNLLGEPDAPRPQSVALLAFGLALAAGSEPAAGRDVFTQWLDEIAP